MRIIKKAAVGGLAACAVAGVALAHDGATGMVMQRMEAMKEIGSGMKVIAAMVKGEKAFDGAAVEAAANVIAGHAKHMPHMFPEGSLDKPTEALPVIWTQWDRFTELSSQLERDALELAAAGKSAGSVEEILPLLGKVGNSCKECHQDFRLAK